MHWGKKTNLMYLQAKVVEQGQIYATASENEPMSW
jgi:hypothetical protein